MATQTEASAWGGERRSRTDKVVQKLHRGREGERGRLCNFSSDKADEYDFLRLSKGVKGHCSNTAFSAWLKTQLMALPECIYCHSRNLNQKFLMKVI